MKIVLTGSTGFVGSEVLEQCRNSPEIDAIVVLTRRPLDSQNYDDKVTNVILKDFTNYSEEAISAINAADACIWCLGGSGAADVEIDFPLAFAKAVSQSREKRQRSFRYVHCSGVLAERDQTKALWFLQDGRRAKGRAETELLSLAEQGRWETYVMRPSMVAQKTPSLVQSAVSAMLGSVRVDDLANAAVRLATHGSNLTTLENNDLVLLGRQ